MIAELAFVLTLSQKVSADECRGDFKMIITGLEDDKGQVKFDLDNNAEAFKPKAGKSHSFFSANVPIHDKKVEYTFTNIQCGEYAIKFYHDSNMNNDLDRNLLGIPSEKYGFSNCKGCTLPPKWQKAKFPFDKDHPTITVEL